MIHAKYEDEAATLCTHWDRDLTARNRLSEASSDEGRQPPVSMQRPKREMGPPMDPRTANTRYRASG